MGKRPHASIEGQLSLFPELEEKPAPRAALEAAPPDPLLQCWGRHLPDGLWLGTSSWSFPGWAGLVYSGLHAESKLSRQGLVAYSRHPLFRAVGIDRSYYGPVKREEYRGYAEQVPDNFRFLVKAPERVTLPRFGRHPRFGDLAGLDNPDFLSATLAGEEWAVPALQGLGEKLGVLLIQFPSLSLSAVGGAASFAVALHDFLQALPAGPVYAVELRNRELFSAQYLQVLERLGVCHCLNLHPSMPSLMQQFESLGAQPLVPIRWMLGSPEPALPDEEWNYEVAVSRYAPFNQLVDEDLSTRAAIVEIWRRSLEAGQQVITIVNNKAEGCAPRSIERLVEEWMEPEAPF
jgi:uncharacterized protein YecE (DUF72 family)